MELKEIIEILMNSGVSVGCLVYFMWYNSSQAEKHNKLLQELNSMIKMLYDKLNKED